MSESFAIVMAVYNERRQLEVFLRRAREVYPDVAITVVSDDGQDYSDVCAPYGVKAIVGEPLKRIEHGAKWLHRLYQTFLDEHPDADVMMQMDPDAWLHRPFKAFPDADVFGEQAVASMMRTPGVRGTYIAGRARGVRRHAVEEFVNTREFLSQVYVNGQFVRQTGGVSCDLMFFYGCQRRRLSVKAWGEVTHRPRPKDDTKFAVSHSIKMIEPVTVVDTKDCQSTEHGQEADRRLVYTVCIGHGTHRLYTQLAPHFVRAVRSVGQHRGDVVVITDEPDLEIPGARMVYVDSRPQYHGGPSQVAKAQELFRTGWLNPAGKLVKIDAHYLIDFSAYSQVMCLDTDVLPIRPLAPLFDLHAECPEAMLVTNGVDQERVTNSFNGRVLTAEEKARWKGDVGYNSGFFVVSGTHGPDQLRVWRRVWEETRHIPGKGVDQPVLNAVLYRQDIRWRECRYQMIFPYLTRGWDRSEKYRDASLMHFHRMTRSDDAERRLNDFCHHLHRRGG